MSNPNPNNELLYFNGVNGATGGYLFPSQTVAEVSEIAQQSISEKLDGHTKNNPSSDSHLTGLRQRYIAKTEGDLGLAYGFDHPKDLSKTGWGIIFHIKTDPQIREALSELIEYRRSQAREYFKEFSGDDSYFGGTANDFLSIYEASTTNLVDPRKVPYYLLIVGDFQTIPFEFQYQLDVQYAVGRIYFDKPEDYAQYARSVVEAETTKLSLPCRANFFGVRNPNDRSTQDSADKLVQPLSEYFTSDSTFLEENSHWNIQTHLAEQATKTQLAQLLGGEETPALLLTASHGVGFPNGDPRQLPHQGALVCQDWPGPKHSPAPLPEDFYFSADDISDSDRLFGLISFHFACYGAGTPKEDQFGHRPDTGWREIAPYSFMANLPQRLLSHPQGGALAFISHMDRAWGQSYYWQGKGLQLESFQTTLHQLMEGYPVGAALESFNSRYAALSSELTSDLWEVKQGKTANDFNLSYMWTANNDARGYMIIGDPAVRVMAGKDAVKNSVHPEIKPGEINFNPPPPDEPPTPPNTQQKKTETQLQTPEDALLGLVNLLSDLSARVQQLEQKVEELQNEVKQKNHE